MAPDVFLGGIGDEGSLAPGRIMGEFVWAGALRGRNRVQGGVSFLSARTIARPDLSWNPLIWCQCWVWVGVKGPVPGPGDEHYRLGCQPVSPKELVVWVAGNQDLPLIKLLA